MNFEEIKKRLLEAGVEPKRSLGQNFLISEKVISRIIEEASSDEFEKMLEIGPGLGSLTDHLIPLAKERGKNFSVIEMDSCFAERWRNLAVDVTEGDALKINWDAATGGVENVLLVSNLPYQISSSLVIDRSINPFGIEKMILMFQKEVAQKIVAKSGDKDYGFLSVIAQSFWRISTVQNAGPVDFYPPPKVASRVLKFHRLETNMKSNTDFLSLVKAAFSQRRKLMVKNLESRIKPLGWDKQRLVETLEEMSLSAKVRAEDLTPEHFQELYERVFE